MGVYGMEKNTSARILISLTALAIGFLSLGWGDQTLAQTANPYYVSPGGNDSNPGTRALPFRTISKGLSMVKAGNTLYLIGGSYSEGINSRTATIPCGSSWTNAVKIAADPGSVPVLAATSSDVINLVHSYIQYLIIDGLVIDASKVGFGISLKNGAHHVRFQNVTVRNAINSGVLVGYGSGVTSYNEFIRMKIHDNGGDKWDHGIYMSTGNNLIEECEIFNNSGYGVHLYNGYAGETLNGNVIRGNRIHHNGVWGIIMGGGNNHAAYNNLLWANAMGGIWVAYKKPVGTKIYNNTIVGGSAAISIASDSSDAIIQNNIAYKIINQGSRTVLSNNYSGDPLFVNLAAGNYQLRIGSPAIDAGISVSIVKTDMNGVPRPKGVKYDIGAYEYVSTTLGAPTNVRIVS
jgi:parallel beta-helix repeat protein